MAMSIEGVPLFFGCKTVFGIQEFFFSGYQKRRRKREKKLVSLIFPSFSQHLLLLFSFLDFVVDFLFF